ncbi:hypothetical protein F511_39992 [Dorcoceras hygrometricum]|uniref:Dystroglycan-like n=1 Tax=Dorcoceras hygrometricum TaxID=472368 RepID=A0A2Z7BZT2_9LAMI|nr:hypothetical protein F511_39992 [Dorcoceras hygrometricum]
MASSLFTNTLHVCFDSVLAMDNPGMVSMFEALMASGLSGFLGCPYVLYEDALTEFFLNGYVRDGKVVSTIRGKQVEISEELFASTFELPVDGLTDLSEIPKDIVFDARSIFSLSGEQVSTSGKKREMKFEFRLLSDILAKTISVKAGSFDEVTQEKFLMMAAITCGVAINWNRLLFNILKDMVTAGSRQAKGYAIKISLLLENVPNLELGDSTEFPSSKILTKKTVHRYIAVNDKVGVEEVADVPRVKKTPVKKAVARKRPATVDEPIVKKKRTRVGKAAAVATDSALEAVPVQVVCTNFFCASSCTKTSRPDYLASSATDISASLAALQESFSKLVANQTRDSRKSGDPNSEVMCKINHVERVFLDSLAAQNEAFRGLFKSIRQEAQNDNNALSLALKAVRAQNAILSTYLAATQKEVKDLQAELSQDFDEKLADIRNDLLEFRVETQEQLVSLPAHLAELIAFITKGSDEKNGEGSSSRPQPPPDDQN